MAAATQAAIRNDRKAPLPALAIASGAMTKMELAGVTPDAVIITTSRTLRLPLKVCSGADSFIGNYSINAWVNYCCRQKGDSVVLRKDEMERVEIPGKRTSPEGTFRYAGITPVPTGS